MTVNGGFGKGWAGYGRKKTSLSPMRGLILADRLAIYDPMPTTKTFPSPSERRRCPTNCARRSGACCVPLLLLGLVFLLFLPELPLEGHPATLNDDQ